MKTKNKLLFKNNFMRNGYFIHKYPIQNMKFNHLTNI